MVIGDHQMNTTKVKKKKLKCKNISFFRNVNYQIIVSESFSCNGFRLLLGI